MELAKRTRLAAAGFRVSSVAEFLELTPEENALIERRLALHVMPTENEPLKTPLQTSEETDCD